MHFAHPGWLWLMVLMPLPWLLERAPAEDRLAGLRGFPPGAASAGSGCGRCRPCCAGWPSAVLAVALARPQTVGGSTRIAGKGVAIVVRWTRARA